MPSVFIFGFIGSLIGFLTNPFVWGPLLAFIVFMTWQNTRRVKKIDNSEAVLIMLEIPRTNDKKELAAEQMFASLHGILTPRRELAKDGRLQEHISFEIASIGQQIRFYVWLPKHLQNFVEGQIYAQYPTVQIHELSEDYTKRDITQEVVYTTELALTDNDVLPIKTFPNFEVDPLAAVTATLAKLDENEELWIQMVARPIDDSWHKRSLKAIEKIRNGGRLGGSRGAFFGYFGQIFSALFKPPEPTAPGASPDLNERDKSRVTAIEEKSRKLGYQVMIRLVYLGPTKAAARLRIQAMVGTFKQFNSTNLNGFIQRNPSFDAKRLAEYQARFMLKEGRTLNIEELASVYHLPHTNVETPNIVWATSKTAEPPSNLPTVGQIPDDELSPFGSTNFRGVNLQFGTKRLDRGRHLYVIGQTGVGKSGLLELLTLSDVFHNQGFAVIDPHGDYASSILQYIPAHRIEDVVYFNPADYEYPVGFNPMEVFDPSLKNHISSEIVGVLKRMFESWGPRLEYILRYTLLALLDTPNTTMLDITRMLTEKGFRQKIIDNIDDPVVRNFWVTEFASWNDKFAAEAVAPVLNKVGAFTANPMVRNIVGQPASTFNIRKLMDEGKILIVNLSRGLVGEDNAAILGALIVTKIQLAAMSRANIAELSDRKPFYLYVDEFQNFATDSFAVILSEARKYGLNLTVANQYISQMTPEVKDAVFGNVGSLVSFRVGAEDASTLMKYFEPQFDGQDLIQLHNRHFVAGISIDGEKSLPFSATTLNIPPTQEDNSAAIIDFSRSSFSKSRPEVEQQIAKATAPVRGDFQANPESRKPRDSHPKARHSDKSPRQRHDSASPQHHQGPKETPAPHKPARKRSKNKHAKKGSQHNTSAQKAADKPIKKPSGQIDEEEIIHLR